jgi:hypothetical protein
MRYAFFSFYASSALTGCEVVVVSPDARVPVSLSSSSSCWPASARATDKNPNREPAVVNLPRALREWNWGGGSCVHASNVMDLRWVNLMQLADWWRKTYSGGESYNGLTAKLKKAKIPFYSTSDGEVDVLDRCTSERRGAVIFYYTNHSILFCGFGPSTKGKKGEFAHVLDNNRIDDFPIEIPRATFVKNWRGYGGVAIVPTAGFPPPPMPYLAKR